VLPFLTRLTANPGTTELVVWPTTCQPEFETGRRDLSSTAGIYEARLHENIKRVECLEGRLFDACFRDPETKLTRFSGRNYVQRKCKIGRGNGQEAG
jgi:hypothetical protein